MFIFEGKCALNRPLFGCQRGYNRQNTQSGHKFNSTFNMFRIVDFAPYHLVSAANSINRVSVLMAVQNCFGQPRSA